MVFFPIPFIFVMFATFVTSDGADHNYINLCQSLYMVGCHRHYPHLVPYGWPNDHLINGSFPSHIMVASDTRNSKQRALRCAELARAEKEVPTDHQEINTSQKPRIGPIDEEELPHDPVTCYIVGQSCNPRYGCQCINTSMPYV